MRARIAVFVVIIQTILFLGHWFVYETWTVFRAEPDPPGITRLQAVLALLSVSFVIATLLAWRYSNFVVRSLYKFAGVWLGMLNFLFLAACSSWIAYLVDWLVGLHSGRPAIARAMFGLAVIVSIGGIINARWIRVKQITVALAGLPPSWRGRVAALVTDVHLGDVNGAGFLASIVARLRQLKPDAVCIAGDLFDGSKVDPQALTEPLKVLSPPFGSYFVTGNHEEFSDPTKYLEAVAGSGVRVLNNEKVMVDGLQIVGVDYRDLARPERFLSALEAAQLDRSRASILLAHAPHGLPIAEAAGVSLQLSGHTHGGQVFPFTWFTQQIFGDYTYGLKRLGKLTVYTSSGSGTWGPPMRVGTRPEIVLIKFA